MYTNPFAQWNLGDGQTPSIAGALPSLEFPASRKLSLIFSPASSVLQSMVYTAQGAACVEIVTNGATTYFRKTDETLLGEIQWRTQPTVVLTGATTLPVNEWLPASSTNHHFSRVLGAVICLWEGADLLGNAKSTGLPDHAQTRIASTALDRAKESIILELTTEAIRYGLSEVCIVAVALLYSNRI